MVSLHISNQIFAKETGFFDTRSVLTVLCFLKYSKHKSNWYACRSISLLSALMLHTSNSINLRRGKGLSVQYDALTGFIARHITD